MHEVVEAEAAVDMVGVVVVMAANKEDTVANKEDTAANREDTVANKEDMVVNKEEGIKANKWGMINKQHMKASKEHMAAVTAVVAALTIAGGMTVINTQRRHMKAGQLLKSVVYSQAQRFILTPQN